MLLDDLERSQFKSGHHFTFINTLDGFKPLIGKNQVTWGCVNGQFKDRLWKIAIKWPLISIHCVKLERCIACLFIFMLVSLQNFAHLRVHTKNVSILS